MIFQCRSLDFDGSLVECNRRIPATGTSGPMDPSIITVSEGVFPCSIGDLDVSIEITHTFRNDLDVTLTHVPTGISVVLWTDVGDGGDDFAVLLDDEAGTAIGNPPCDVSADTCIGIFQPEPPAMLSAFDGIDPAGDWRLDIEDDDGGDTGNLLNWSLIISMTDDSDFDGVPDCFDACPGVADDSDSDGDGVPDCADNCPADPNKLDPGQCGCGNPDTDTDADGVADCNDNCPADPNKLDPGDCGCGNPDTDTDGDGVADCDDNCPADPNKLDPGDCGCGNPDTDTNGNGIPDCIDPPAPPATLPDPDPCAPAAMMMMPMTLLGIGWMRRRSSRRRNR